MNKVEFNKLKEKSYYIDLVTKTQKSKNEDFRIYIERKK